MKTIPNIPIGTSTVDLNSEDKVVHLNIFQCNMHNKTEVQKMIDYLISIKDLFNEDYTNNN